MVNIMKKFLAITTSFLLAFGVILALGAPEVAAQGSIQEGVQSAQGQGVPTNLFGDAGIITTITNILLFIAGALAVIMLIWGGIRYTISGGNSANVTAAKNTVLYAIVGLIVAFLAFAAVNWVLGVITPGAGGAGFSNR
jgi:hypothetical protein